MGTAKDSSYVNSQQIDSKTRTAVAIECAGSDEKCKPIFKLLAARIDAVSDRVEEHEARLGKGDKSLNELDQLTQLVRSIDRKMTILETRFAIIWAGLGVVGTLAVGAVVAAFIAVLGGGKG